MVGLLSSIRSRLRFTRRFLALSVLLFRFILLALPDMGWPARKGRPRQAARIPDRLNITTARPPWRKRMFVVSVPEILHRRLGPETGSGEKAPQQAFLLGAHAY